MTTQVQKLSISLPRALVELIDEIARDTVMKRSRVVSSCLEDLASKRFQADMEEGYRVMADEHSKFAEMTSAIAHEVVPAWDK